MDPASVVLMVVAGIFGLLLWSLRQALVNLETENREQRKELKAMTDAMSALKDSLWREFVRKQDLEGFQTAINDLFSKVNALAVQCAQRHGNGDK